MNYAAATTATIGLYKIMQRFLLIVAFVLFFLYSVVNWFGLLCTLYGFH